MAPGAIENASQLRRVGETDAPSEKQIREIQLRQLDDDCYKKLNSILQHSPLVKVELGKCFPDADHFAKALKSLGENTLIKDLNLQLQENQFNVDCADEIRNLLSRRILAVLGLPRGMDETSTAEILQEIHEKDIKLEELSIAGSVINDISKDRLKNILQKALITKKLNMCGCKGVANTTLTSQDKQDLEMSIKDPSRFHWKFWQTTKKVEVLWFDCVQFAGPAENDEDYETRVVEQEVRAMHDSGKWVKIFRTLIREKLSSEWQYLRRGKRKRRVSGEARSAKAARVVDVEMAKEGKDDLGGINEMLNRTKLGQEPPSEMANSTQTTVHCQAPQPELEAAPIRSQSQEMETSMSDVEIASELQSATGSPSLQQEHATANTFSVPNNENEVKTPPRPIPIYENTPGGPVYDHGNNYPRQPSFSAPQLFDNNNEKWNNMANGPGDQSIETPLQDVNRQAWLRGQVIDRQVSERLGAMQSQKQQNSYSNLQQREAASQRNTQSFYTTPYRRDQTASSRTPSRGRNVNKQRNDKKGKNNFFFRENSNINFNYTGGGPQTRSMTRNLQQQIVNQNYRGGKYSKSASFKDAQGNDAYSTSSQPHGFGWNGTNERPRVVRGNKWNTKRRK